MFDLTRSLQARQLNKVGLEAIVHLLSDRLVAQARVELEEGAPEFREEDYAYLRDEAGRSSFNAAELAAEWRSLREVIVQSEGLSGVTGGFTSLTVNGITTTQDRPYDRLVLAGMESVADEPISFALELSSHPIEVTISQYGGGYVEVHVKLDGYGEEDFWMPFARELMNNIVEVVDQFPMPATSSGSPFRVFIGHGGDTQWKVLKLLLEQTHGFVTEAFESEERAGYTTLETIDLMVRSSAVGVVIMSGTDEMKDGSVRARENVVHEVGFCQGALGISNTIVLLEEGVSEFTNIAGLTQIRFKKGDIISAEQKIVAALSLRRAAFDAAGGFPRRGHGGI